MTADERLLYESRVRMRQSVIASAAGVLLVAASVVQITGPQPKVSELTVALITFDKRATLDIIGALINACAVTLVALTLSFLFGAARARNEMLRGYIRQLVIVGAGLAIVGGMTYSIELSIKAHEFVTHGQQTYEQANALTRSGLIVAVPFVLQGGELLLAIGFVMVSLNAMRVGLLTRFMGYLGMFTGALVLFPIGSPVPVVQGFWLVALGSLLAGRWPSGVPPAWRTGRAEPWPSAQEIREQRMRAAGRVPKPAGRPAPEPVAAPMPSRTRASTPKRKRKRRR